MAYYLDACAFTAGSNSTANFIDGTAITGFRNLSNAGAVNGRRYPYRAENTAKTEWENGFGVYSSTAGSLTRQDISASSNSNNAVNFTTNPKVFIAPLRRDFERPGRSFAMATLFGG